MVSTAPSTDSAQLTRMTVSNYRSIGEDVSIDFEPLTVLVGINGSGKSNLLDAPRFVAQALTDGLENSVEQRHGFKSMLRDAGGPQGTMSIRLELDHPEWTADYTVELGAPKQRPDEYSIRQEKLEVIDKASQRVNSLLKNRLGNVTSTWSGLEAPVRDKRSLALFAVGGDARLAPMVTALRRVETYSLFPETLREPQRPSQRDYLSKFGDNWPSVVRTVMASDAKRDLRQALDRLTGDIIDLRVRRLGVVYLVAEFGHHRPDGSVKWFDAARESDGTLRVAGILTALSQSPPLTMIGVEEPELTVHSGVIPILADFLHEASLSSRVLVTTHSPELLEQVPADAIRVVERIDGTSRVGRVAEQQLDLVKKKLASPGDLMRSQGLLAEEP